MAEASTEVKVSNTRTRINLSQTAKGLIQFDITCEYDSVDQSIAEAEKAVTQTKALIKKLGLKAVDDVA